MTPELLTGPLFDEWMTTGDVGDTTPALAPASGEVVATFRNASSGDVDEAVQTARRAFATWRRTTPADRAALLLELATRLEADSTTFARAESVDVGKPMAAALEEIAYDADVLRFMAGAARISSTAAAGEYTNGATSMTRREPLGVVALIAPWNFPLMEAMWKIAPALAAGNTVIIKPSELTPLSTLLFVQLAQEVLPAGVLKIVLGAADTGRALVDHPDIALVSLTGDVATGKKVAAAAAASLKKVHLELGGKAPVIVFADVDLTATAKELAGIAFLNAGQDCGAPCRVIVEDAAYGEFVEAYVAAVDQLKVGDPDDDTAIGPLISQRQLDRVAGFVERARASGATVLTGGERLPGPGFFYPPTVVVGVAQDDEIVQNEVFGPVVTIQRGHDDDEILAMANDVQYGLTASVWTADVGRSLRFARELSFGTVWINQHLVLANEMPFGGYGQSGYGKELSAAAVDEYAQIKHVSMKSSD
ncbi:aminobutyraldehyde dehydrogenase [Nocardioides sp. KIGAM211]|uniref:Salicylaldehyde dehydrogenase n=1 Tax=Nocardioides luti TaxID=2761101 RepID=A0A7X0RFY5_9ACTN|nr:aminobutyraldehyde dehydrogenase [Nocardioides luti]MBB6627586.1 aminobutyraldehyde dehydrogenase [Nocardioides luti]